jgi:SAM-dependent methyltransferase
VDAPARPLYGSFAWAYDLVVAGSAGPPPELVARLFAERGVSPPAAVMDAGCGTGRYAIELARQGFEVTGVDRSAELVAAALQRARAARTAVRFVVMDLGGWRSAARFDAALCRGVLNDLLTDAERRSALAALAASLRSGGVLVVDVREWDASAARYRSKPVYERTADSPRGRVSFRSETQVWEPQRSLVVRERYGLEGADGHTRQECTFVMRCWTADELQRLAAEAGFRTVELRQEREVREDRLVAVAVR